MGEKMNMREGNERRRDRKKARREMGKIRG